MYSEQAAIHAHQWALIGYVVGQNLDAWKLKTRGSLFVASDDVYCGAKGGENGGEMGGEGEMLVVRMGQEGFFLAHTPTETAGEDDCGCVCKHGSCFFCALIRAG